MKIFSVNFKVLRYPKSKLRVSCGMNVFYDYLYGRTFVKVAFDRSYNRFSANVYKSYNSNDCTEFSDVEMPYGEKLKTGYFINSKRSEIGTVFVPTVKDLDSAAMVFFGERDIVKPYTSMVTGQDCLNENKLSTGRLSTFWSDTNDILYCSHCGCGMLEPKKNTVDRIIDLIPESEIKYLMGDNYPRPLTKEIVRGRLMHEHFHLKKGKADIATCSKELHDKLIGNNIEALSAFINEEYLKSTQNGSYILVIPDGTSFDFIAHNEVDRGDFTKGSISYKDGKLSVQANPIKTLPFYKVEE